MNNYPLGKCARPHEHRPRIPEPLTRWSSVVATSDCVAKNCILAPYTLPPPRIRRGKRGRHQGPRIKDEGGVFSACHICGKRRTEVQRAVSFANQKVELGQTAHCSAPAQPENLLPSSENGLMPVNQMLLCKLISNGKNRAAAKERAAPPMVFPAF